MTQNDTNFDALALIVGSVASSYVLGALMMFIDYVR